MPPKTKNLTFNYAVKSFTGYLEGTSKASLSITSYCADLKSFEDYLKKLAQAVMGSSQRAKEKEKEDLAFSPSVIEKKLTQFLKTMTLKDLEKYSEYLKSQGLKTNTRRRKLLTVRRFFRYLKQRNKIKMDISVRLPAPHKLEKSPEVISYEKLLGEIKKLPMRNLQETRNKALLWVLAETGCRVSEAVKLKFQDVTAEGVEQKNSTLYFIGKNERVILISNELCDIIFKLREQSAEKQAWIFLGFNKFGPLKSAISSRGVELLCKIYEKRLNVGELTPRKLRHSRIAEWLQQGIPQTEIQKILGLKSLYAFRIYAPWINKNELNESKMDIKQL